MILMITKGEQVKIYFEQLANGEKDSANVAFSRNFPMSSGLRGAINGILSKALGGNENRKLFLKYLTGHSSSKELSDGQWYALYCLVQPFRDPLIGWISDNPNFESAMGALLVDMARQDGQTEMEL